MARIPLPHRHPPIAPSVTRFITQLTPLHKHTGVLSQSELKSFFTYAGRKLMWSPGLAELLQGVQSEVTSGLGDGPCSRERFLQVRFPCSL
jgi:hypothetical protein